MALDSQWALQEAVFAALEAAAPVTSLLANGAQSVFDHVPPESAFPYLVIDGFFLRPNDTVRGDGAEVTVTLRVYSRYEGQSEVKAIMSAVTDTLHHADLAASGQTVVLARLVSAETSLMQDGVSREGIIRFRFITEPST